MCPCSGQLEKLNRWWSVLQTDESSPRRAAGDVRTMLRPEGDAEQKLQDGPTTEELRDLQQRLAQACRLAGHRTSSEDSMGTVLSAGVHSPTFAGGLVGKMPSVSSNCSLSTMVSEDAEDKAFIRGSVMEFDMTIVEDPEPYQPSSCNLRHQQSDSPRQCQQSPQRQQQERQWEERGMPSQPGATKRRPFGQPVPRSTDDATTTGQLPQWPAERLRQQQHVMRRELIFGGRKEAPTTLMIRNVPVHYTQGMLIWELEQLGMAEMFDFLYLPAARGPRSDMNQGFAFVNFVDASCAEKCMVVLQRYRFRFNNKIAQVSLAHVQGLQANLERYQKGAHYPGLAPPMVRAETMSKMVGQ